MKLFELPVNYKKLQPFEKRLVREQYIEEQDGLCFYCKTKLDADPPREILDKEIRLEFFPKGFFNNPVHLQHDHQTLMTEGAVHAYCNAVMWQYEGR